MDVLVTRVPFCEVCDRVIEVRAGELQRDALERVYGPLVEDYGDLISVADPLYPGELLELIVTVMRVD